MKRLFLILTLFLTLLIFFGCSGKKNSPDTVIAQINGESITQQELDYYTAQLRPTVMSSMIDKYSAVYDEGFWQSELGDTTPEDELYRLALETCCRKKLLLIMCRENGIYADISFAALQSKALAYNKNPNTVGLKSIDADSFYDYYIDNGALELKNLLSNSQLKPSDAEIDDFIESMSAAEKQGVSTESLRAHAQNILIGEKLEAHIEKELIRAETVTVEQSPLNN